MRSNRIYLASIYRKTQTFNNMGWRYDSGRIQENCGDVNMADYEIFLPRTLDNEYDNLNELYHQLDDILPYLSNEDEVYFNF